MWEYLYIRKYIYEKFVLSGKSQAWRQNEIYKSYLKKFHEERTLLEWHYMI